MTRVIVIGGGIGGLTSAHELAERGFEVHVYEARNAWGGKARTQPVAGTGTGGRLDLPGEHGFRFYPRFYRHVIDMMARTPAGEGATVESRLRPVTEAGVALINGRKLSRFHRKKSFRPAEVVEAAETMFKEFGLDPGDAAMFAVKVLQFLTSSEERRIAEYEGMSWWQFLGVDRFSARCQTRADGIPRMLVAMDARYGNARTVGSTSMQLLLDYTTTGQSVDRTMSGPTSEVWIDPWIRELERLGVKLHPGETCTGLEVADGRVAGAHFASGSVARGEHYVLAVPLECAHALMSEELAALDPQCERLRSADIDKLVSWMVGIQFYLHEDVQLARGHLVFPDSPWALTAISQPQFWTDGVGRFRRRYGDGEVGGLLSVDISQWDNAGTFVKKTAKECTPQEVKDEVWWQLKAALNGEGADEQVLTDELLHSWHLDDDLDYSRGLPPHNSSRLLVHPAHSWSLRPEAASSIPNLCFASDYVRTHTDIASMEAACEAGRRAANAVLDREQSSAPRARIWPLEEPPDFDAWKKLDAELFRQGRPHFFEQFGVKRAFEAADMLRRFASLASLGKFDEIFGQFKLVNVVGGLLSRWKP
ncbi:MAG TPA: FAD-dependent oxidoreductase [Polyangiaceae bacterium]